MASIYITWLQITQKIIIGGKILVYCKGNVKTFSDCFRIITINYPAHKVQAGYNLRSKQQKTKVVKSNTFDPPSFIPPHTASSKYNR